MGTYFVFLKYVCFFVFLGVGVGGWFWRTIAQDCIKQLQESLAPWKQNILT